MASCWVMQQGAKAQKTSWDTKCASNGCCAHGDLCLDNHMCYSLSNGTGLDYYPAGCRDENFPSGDCPQKDWCPSEIQPALVNWIDNNNWQCCGHAAIGLHPSCNPATGNKFSGPLPKPQYDQDVANLKHVSKLAVGAIVGIAVAAGAFLIFAAVVLWCCCCSKRARDKRSRGKFVPIGSGRDMPGDNVVWNSNVHDGGHELHDGPMGGYASQPHGPGYGGAPQYTVQGFR